MFRYDQLNRIRKSEHFEGTGTVTWATSGAFETQYSYDANGNILALKRIGNTTTGTGMDDLTYNYYAGTNKLEYVTDGASSSYTNDIGTQGSGNYIYATCPGNEMNGNELGQMTRDPIGTGDIEDFDVSWSVYNKVTKVEWGSGSIEELRLTGACPGSETNGNAMQKRVTKAVDRSGTTGDEWFYYVTDATGNVLSIYHEERDGSDYVMYWEEAPIYGSSRVGMMRKGTEVSRRPIAGGGPTEASPVATDVYYRELGKKVYELTDHLGNVRVVVSDHKQSDVGGGSPADFEAEVESMVGYYAFGMEMPGIKYSSGTGYRFGYQGQEKDDEIHGEGNSINYTYRMHDPRIGRFMSVDPLASKYPYNSTYAFSENRVIDGVELEGREFKYNGFDVENGTTIIHLTCNFSIVENTGIKEAYNQKNYLSFMSKQAERIGQAMKKALENAELPQNVKIDFKYGYYVPEGNSKPCGIVFELVNSIDNNPSISGGTLPEYSGNTWDAHHTIAIGGRFWTLGNLPHTGAHEPLIHGAGLPHDIDDESQQFGPYDESNLAHSPLASTNAYHLNYRQVFKILHTIISNQSRNESPESVPSLPESIKEPESPLSRVTPNDDRCPGAKKLNNY